MEFSILNGDCCTLNLKAIRVYVLLEVTKGVASLPVILRDFSERENSCFVTHGML